MNISKNFISTFVATTLLSVTTLSATECVGGHCHVNVGNLSKEKVKVQKFSKVGQANISSHSQMNRQVSIVPAPSQVMEYVDESYTVIIDGQEVVRLTHDHYVMNDVEKADFYANEELDNTLLNQPLKRIDERIMEKTTLPQSEYFCEIPKKPVFMNTNGIYECV